MFSISRLTACLTATGVVAAAPIVTSADLAATLDLAPASADLVVAVPSIDEASDAIAAFSRGAGLQVPELDDAMGSMFEEMGLRGLDRNGGAVFAIAGLADAMANDTEPDVLLILPVSDYAELAASMGAAETGGGLTEGRLGDGGDAWLRQEGDHAIIGPKQDMVADYAAGGVGQAQLDAVAGYASQNAEDDIAKAILRLDNLRPAMRDGLVDMRAELIEEFGADNPDVDAEAFADMVVGFVEVFVEGSDAVVLGLDAGPAGVGLDGGMAMVEGSTLASYFNAPQTPMAELLNDLPGGKYLVASAIDCEAIDMARLAPQVRSFMELALEGADIDADLLALADPLLDSLDDILENVTASTSAIYPPVGGMGPGNFYAQLGTYRTRDGVEVRDAVREVMKAVVDGVETIADGDDAAAAGGGMPAKPSVEMSFVPDELRIDGHEVDYFRFGMPMDPGMAANPMAAMLGANESEGYIATVGDTLVVTGSADQALLTRGIDALADAGGLGAEAGIAAAQSQGVDQPFASAYVSVGGIAELASPMAAMFLGIQIAPPQDLAPLSYELGTDGSALATRFFVPIEVVSFVRETAEAAGPVLGGMGGGMGGGGMEPEPGRDGPDGPPAAPF